MSTQSSQVVLPPHLGGHLWKTHTDEGALKYFRSLGCHSFLDVGCGPGNQVELARQVGFKSLGIDGDWTLQGPPYLLIADFTKGRIELPWQFDLVWSVEVAEHIAKPFESQFLESCAGNCQRYFVMTASPNPRPKLHVNVKPREYWIERVVALGMTLREDLLSELLAQSTMEREFLHQSGMVFSKEL